MNGENGENSAVATMDDRAGVGKAGGEGKAGERASEVYLAKYLAK